MRSQKDSSFAAFAWTCFSIAADGAMLRKVIFTGIAIVLFSFLGLSR
jgi:hypothetical protein